MVPGSGTVGISWLGVVLRSIVKVNDAGVHAQSYPAVMSAIGSLKTETSIRKGAREDRKIPLSEVTTACGKPTVVIWTLRGAVAVL